jgi:hypothetical protein
MHRHIIKNDEMLVHLMVMKFPLSMTFISQLFNYTFTRCRMLSFEPTYVITIKLYLGLLYLSKETFRKM